MRVREAGRCNPVIAAGVDLYIAYRTHRHLLKKGEEGRLHLISTHKLYELWILGKVLQRVGAIQLAGRLSLKTGGRFVNGIEVEYDVWHVSGLRSLAGGAHIRPDIVVKLPGGRTLVIDAKYKEEVSEEDLRSRAFTARTLRRHGVPRRQQDVEIPREENRAMQSRPADWLRGFRLSRFGATMRLCAR
jgi:hypothetical protein